MENKIMKWIKKADKQNNLRFDVNARIEIWIEAHEIEMNPNFNAIMMNGKKYDDKIQEFKQIALDEANAKINNVEGIEITSDIAIDTINIDRIDWQKMLIDWMETYYYRNENMTVEALKAKFVSFGIAEDEVNEFMNDIK